MSTEHRVGDMDGGYTLSSSAITGTGLNLNGSGGAQFDVVGGTAWERTLTAADRVTVYSGATLARYYLPPATGTGLTYYVRNASPLAIVVTLDAGFNGYIDGANTYSINQGYAIQVVDYGPGQWATLTPQAIPVPVTAYHAVADVNFTIAETTNFVVVGYSSLTTSRTVTLPAASAAGQVVTVRDESGSCSWAKTITLAAAGTDKIHNGAAVSVPIWVARGSITLMSNGSGSWVITDRSPKCWYVRWTANTTYTAPPDGSLAEIGAQGGGGGGGSMDTSVFNGGGGGGTCGGWVAARFNLAAGTAYTVTIGAGGIAGAAGGAPNGGNGGTTSFGTLLTAYGGNGGLGTTTTTGGAGATATTTAMDFSRGDLAFPPLSTAATVVSGNVTTAVMAMPTGGHGCSTAQTGGTAGGKYTGTTVNGGAVSGATGGGFTVGGGGSASLWANGGAGATGNPSGGPTAAVAGTLGSGGGGAGMNSSFGLGAAAAGGPGFVDFYAFF